MEDLDKIVAALAVVGTGAGEAAGRDAYDKLKGVVMRRFQGSEKAQAALANPKPDSTKWRNIIRKALIKSGALEDDEVRAAAQKVLEYRQASTVTGLIGTYSPNSVILAGVNHLYNSSIGQPNHPPAPPVAS